MNTDSYDVYNFVENLNAPFNSSTDYSSAITSAVSKYKEVYLSGGKTYNINSSIKLTDNDIGIRGKSWKNSSSINTTIKPSGDFPAIQCMTTQNVNRWELSNIVFDGSKLSLTTPLLQFNPLYSSTFQQVRVMGSVDLKNVDSLRCIDCRFYGNGITLTIGEGCRSINFIGCNFEADPNYPDKFYNIVIDLTPSNGMLTGSNGGTGINFIGCQFENVNIIFKNCSSCHISNTKMYRTNLLMDRTTSNIKIDSFDIFSSSFGNYGLNSVRGLKCNSVISTGLYFDDYVPSIIKNSDNSYTMANDLMITQVIPMNWGVSSATLSYTDSNNNVIQSEGFTLRKIVPYSMGAENCFTDFQVLNGNIKVSCSDSSVNVRPIPLTNMLGSSMLTGWKSLWSSVISKSSVATAIDSHGNLVITVNATSGVWGITKSVNFDINKKYMLMMKYSTTGSQANILSNGLTRDIEVSSQLALSDGSYLAQSYLHGISRNIAGIGGFSAKQGDIITIKWIAIVEI